MPKVNWVDTEISKQELACIYSALILADDDIPITAEKLNTLIKVAGVEVESIWPSLFARALEGANVRELILNSVSGGAMSGGPAAPVEEQKPQVEAPPKQVESEEDSDEDFGLSLFD